MRSKGDNPDLAIAAVAARQHGVITRGQLRAVGVSEAAVSRRAANGRLHRLHRGVYAVGHPGISIEGRWMAAVLACGEGAVLSHVSAAALWKLLDPRPGPVHVSVPTSAGRRGPLGVRLHRRRALTGAVVCRHDRIPTTTTAQTIADLRRAVSAASLRHAIRQAEVLGRNTGLEEAIEPTRSELEHLFLRLCERRHLPAPKVNVRIGSRVVDFLWSEQRLVVETDGYRFHRGSRAFEDDHERDLELRSHGFDVLRLTYGQVTRQPDRVGDSVAAALGRR